MKSEWDWAVTFAVAAAILWGFFFGSDNDAYMYVAIVLTLVSSLFTTAALLREDEDD